MLDYLTPDYAGAPFELFGVAHVLTMLVIGGFGYSMIRFARQRGDPFKQRLRLTLAGVLLFSEICWHVWAIVYGEWTIEIGLPFHLCSLLVWLTIVALWKEKPALYPLLYFLGIGASLQGVLTPDAGPFGFPHFRFLQTMIVHGGLAIAGFWVVFVEGYRPDFKSVTRLFLGLNVYAAVMYPLNRAIGSNYLYLVAKPDTASLLDVFPAWPLYLLVLEALALGLFILLYLPFRRKPQTATSIQ